MSRNSVMFPCSAEVVFIRDKPGMLAAVERKYDFDVYLPYDVWKIEDIRAYRKFDDMPIRGKFGEKGYRLCIGINLKGDPVLIEKAMAIDWKRWAYKGPQTSYSFNRDIVQAALIEEGFVVPALFR